MRIGCFGFAIQILYIKDRDGCTPTGNDFSPSLLCVVLLLNNNKGLNAPLQWLISGLCSPSRLQSALRFVLSNVLSSPRQLHTLICACLYRSYLWDNSKLKYILLFSGTPSVAIKAWGGVSKLALPSSFSFDLMAGFLSVGVLRRMSAFHKNEAEKIKANQLTSIKLSLLTFSSLSCCVCGNSSLEPVFAIAAPWDRRFHFPSCFPGCGRTEAASPGHTSATGGFVLLTETGLALTPFFFWSACKKLLFLPRGKKGAGISP